MTFMLTVLCLPSPGITTLSMTKLIRTVLNETKASTTIKMRHSAQYYVLMNGTVKPNVLIVEAQNCQNGFIQILEFCLKKWIKSRLKQNNNYNDKWMISQHPKNVLKTKLIRHDFFSWFIKKMVIIWDNDIDETHIAIHLRVSLTLRSSFWNL